MQEEKKKNSCRTYKTKTL